MASTFDVLMQQNLSKIQPQIDQAKAGAAFTQNNQNMISALQSRLSGMSAPTPITDFGSAYQAKDFSGALPEFDSQRNIADQQLNSQAQQNSDAIQRRFAAMGNMNSGAYAKAQQMADNSAAQTRANTMQGIGFQEAQQRRALQQNEANKAFESQEALNARKMQGQEFNQGQQNQFNQFQFGAGSNLMQMGMANQQQDLQRRQQAFENDMANYQAQHSGGLLGAGGILGTGIGA